MDLKLDDSDDDDSEYDDDCQPRWICVRRESFMRSLADTTILSGDNNK